MLASDDSRVVELLRPPIPLLILSVLLIMTCLSGQSYGHTINNFEADKTPEQPVRTEDETAQQSDSSEKWYQRVKFSGLVEAEVALVRIEPQVSGKDGTTTATADLENIELALDIQAAPQAVGHVMIKYENEDLFIDEGYISLRSSMAHPIHLVVGRQYLPFGIFNSAFVTDPTTLTLGETSIGALVLGYNIWKNKLDGAVGVFNSSSRNADRDDMIDNYVASLAFEPTAGILLSISYISDLADAGGLNDAAVDSEKLYSRVGAWSAFAAWTIFDRYTINAEYLAAINSYGAGELYDTADIHRRRPSAWNFELHLMMIDCLQVGIRYGGTYDGDSGTGRFFPQLEAGVVANWQCTRATNLALEYLHRNYQNNDQTADAVTMQLAIHF